MLAGRVAYLVSLGDFMRKSWALLFAAFAAGVAGLSQATAQTPPAPSQGYFDRDRNISVSQRREPSLAPLGIPAGAFRLYPELYLGAGYTDNAYATDVVRESSTIGVGQVSANLVSDWGRHALNLFGVLGANTYFDASQADTYTINLGFDGRADLSLNSILFGGASVFVGKEPLTQNPAVGLISPVRYEQVLGNVGYQVAFNRLQLTAELSAADYNYRDSTLFTGQRVAQDFRDFQSLTASLRSAVALTHETALFAQYSYTDIDYDLTGAGGLPARDAIYHEFLVGADFDLTNLIRGNVGAGYYSRRFDSAALANLNGFAINAGVEYFVTPLVTLSVDARRGISESALLTATSVRDTSIRVGADYEFRRNILVSLGGEYRELAYQGIDRRDDRWSLDGTVDYKLNRWSAISVQAAHIWQDSSGTAVGRDFNQFQTLVGLRLYR